MTHCNRCGKDNPADVHTCTPLALVLADAIWPFDDGIDNNLSMAAAELRRLSAEVDEQCRLNGMGSEREAALMARVDRLRAVNAELLEALRLAEAGLADIGDADREPGDDLAWCERRAAEPLPAVRAAIAKAKAKGETK